jgi:ATP phosphoribosyltransferase
VLEGSAEMAVVGLDTLLEFNAAAQNRNAPAPGLAIALRLPGVSACGLHIAAPASLALDTPRDLSGLRIATSYPELLAAWVREKKAGSARIVVREGGVEDTIRLGMADAICDVVQSGESLRANGLAKKFMICGSSAVVVTRAGAPVSPAADIFLRRLRETQAKGAIAPALAG